jgi:PAS domain S-box-containing protein
MNSTRILVVEEDLIVADHIRKTLVRHGYVVPVMTGYGKEAVKLAAKIRPDLVLMDTGLLGPMDGIDAAALIKPLGIPVIYLAGPLDAEARQRAAATEPFGIIGKPFGEQELWATVEIALCKQRIERELRERGQWPSAALHGIDHALVTTDPDGRITSANAGAERLTGWSQADARNRSVREVLRLVSEKGHELADPFEPVFSSATATPISRYVLLSRHGGRAAVDGGAAPIRDGTGRVSGAVIVLIAEEVGP